MAETAYYIAVDLGAESGRVMLGSIADGKLGLEEMHRFTNGPTQQGGSLRWDFARIFSEIKQVHSTADHLSVYINIDLSEISSAESNRDIKLGENILKR